MRPWVCGRKIRPSLIQGSYGEAFQPEMEISNLHEDLKTYRYRQFDWHPGAALRKPLPQARITVVTTAAFFRPDQAPFDASLRGGDYSFREIPVGTGLDTLKIGHKSDAFDHSGIESDKELGTATG